MSLLIFAGIVTVIFIIGMIREPRSYWNAILFMFDLGLIVIAMSFQKGILAIIAALCVILIPLVFFGFAVFLIVNGIKILRKERFCLSNSLALLLGIFMIAGSFLSLIGMIYFQNPSFLRSLFYLVLAIECYLAFSFAALLIYSWLYTYMPKKIDCDYIIVHGCSLKNGETVTPLLKGRVDKAAEVYKKAKSQPKIVVSGGKGGDEKISEAEAMKNYLLENSFPEDDIIMEDKSTTTFENLKNVKEMLDTTEKKNRYIFVTSNYHVFRTGLLARKLKMNAQGIGCKTASYYWPSAFIREYIAIMAKYIWVFGAIVVIWGIIEVLVHLI